MTEEKYRILTLDASGILEQTTKNGEDVGVCLPKKKSDAFFRKFDNYFDYSLETEELRKTFENRLGRGFDLVDKSGFHYTLAVVNVSFKYRLKGEENDDEQSDTFSLRQKLYKNGFRIDGKKYVRYKRSAGSSRQGKCLFIRQELFKHMNEWSLCGLDEKKADKVSLEAYKALTLSALNGFVDIPVKGILFVQDYESVFRENVITVKKEGSDIIAKEESATIENNIWDGEALLDESVFVGKYADKHMLLLRNKFFKSCAFRTKLKKWFRDNDIRSVDQLKAHGVVTLADDMNDVVMVTTSSSLKYLKISGKPLSEESIRDWGKYADERFGVVKYDKRTRFFEGKMVKSSYQFINTLPVTKEEAESLLQKNAEFLSAVRADPAITRYYIKHLVNREKEDSEEEKGGIIARGDILFDLIDRNIRFSETELYDRFRGDLVKMMRNELYKGRLLLSGKNATLFGNGPELLKATIGKFDGTSVLENAEVRCAGFPDGQELVCARYPHITMGNLYSVTNNLSDEIFDYFDLGENVVCVNSIGENIQQRLNGCDYDSDMMLLVDDETIVGAAKRHADDFKVPVCKIEVEGKTDRELFEIDAMTGENRIGEIVNLSQRLNGLLWDELNGGKSWDDVKEIYYDICILAVTSGIEIDKAKRNYGIDAGEVIAKLAKKYIEKITFRPYFFKEITYKNVEEDKKTEKKVIRYRFYRTPMDFVYMRVSSATNYVKGKPKKKNFLPLSQLFLPDVVEPTRNDYCKKDRICELLKEYNNKIRSTNACIRESDKEEQEILIENLYELKRKMTEDVLDMITSVQLLKLVLTSLQKKKEWTWMFYETMLCSDSVFRDQLIVKTDERLPELRGDPSGDIALFDFRYVKVFRK